MRRVFRSLLAIAAAAAAALLLPVSAAAECSVHQFDNGEIVEAPTCETIGVTVYTCQNEGCGYSYAEKIGNLGHRYSQGICLTCGSADPFYVPGDEPELPEEPTAPEAPTVPEEPEIPDAPSAEVPEDVLLSAPSIGGAISWEPPAVNSVVPMPDSIHLSAPTGDTAEPAPQPEASNLPLYGGLALILLAAGFVFLTIRKPQYA